MILARASSTARVRARHSSAGKPNSSVKRITALRTTHNISGLLSNSSRRSHPARCKFRPPFQARKANRANESQSILAQNRFASKKSQRDRAGPRRLDPRTAPFVANPASGTRGCRSELFTDEGRDAGSQNLNRPQHLLVRERGDAHLERNASEAAKDFVH